MQAQHMPDEALPLERLYLHLVQAGFPLSVRDYADALRALRLGHGVGRREDLYTLVRNLWARGEEDVVRLDALFRHFARPTAEDVLLQTGAAARAAATGQPLPQPDSASAPANGAAGADAASRSASVAAQAPRAEFAGAGEQGVGLPSARSTPRTLRPYVFAHRLPMTERSLVIAWRRLRSVLREGPAVELDVAATVAQQCRTGWMLAPVLLPARRNQARLLVLADASASMLPWRGLWAPLADSLRQSRLASAQLLYFNNDPRDGLSASPRLQALQPAAPLLREHAANAAVLVISDAGCARGRADRSRLAGMRSFVAAARLHAQALAWVNPMPAARWGVAAAAVRPAGAMFELGEDGLTRAVDHLRGLHA